jgi:predicted ABC-type ATPase
MNQPIFTVLAGVNGAGKTSLYNVKSKDGDLGERINIDEIVGDLGSWKDKFLQIKAARAAMIMINNCISQGISFHEETTMPGGVMLKMMKRAKEAGYSIVMYFVGVDDIEIAIQRVHRRIEKGGHGLDDNLIRKRYERLTECIHDVVPVCDRIVFYDNTVRFRQVAIMQDGVLLDCDHDLPSWFTKLF